MGLCRAFLVRLFASTFNDVRPSQCVHLSYYRRFKRTSLLRILRSLLLGKTFRLINVLRGVFSHSRFNRWFLNNLFASAQASKSIIKAITRRSWGISRLISKYRTMFIRCFKCTRGLMIATRTKTMRRCVFKCRLTMIFIEYRRVCFRAFFFNLLNGHTSGVINLVTQGFRCQSVMNFCSIFSRESQLTSVFQHLLPLHLMLFMNFITRDQAFQIRTCHGVNQIFAFRSVFRTISGARSNQDIRTFKISAQILSGDMMEPVGRYVYVCRRWIRLFWRILI